MPGMGFLTCNLQIGSETYQQQFIVCRQLTPGIILGCDFLSRNQLGITWGPEGTLQLRDEQDLSVQTAEEVANPTVKLAAKTVIPLFWFWSQSQQHCPHVRIRHILNLSPHKSTLIWDQTVLYTPLTMHPSREVYKKDYKY